MANPIPNTQTPPPQGVAMAFDDGTQAYVPHENVQDAVRDGGKLVQPMTFDDGSKAWVPFDNVHDAIHDGGQLLLPGVSRPQLPMEKSTLGTVYSGMVDGPGGGQPLSNPKFAGSRSTAEWAEREAQNPSVTTQVATGALKGGLQTVHTVGRLANAATGDSIAALPTSIKPPASLQPEGVAENIGAGVEGIGEFLTGDEALKGLSLAQRLGIAKHVAELAEKSPRLARMIELGMNAIRGGGVTVPQQMAHGASPTEALETGATATGLGIGTGVVAEAVDASGIPGKITKVVKGIAQGKAAASPEGEAALRGAAASTSKLQAAEANPSLRSGLEKPIDSIEAEAKVKYRQIDKAAGTDFKSLTAKLENTNYQIRQLTETEEDIAKEAKLEKSRSALIEKIEQAKQDAVANGVDPKILDEADAQFTQKEALKEVQAKVFKNPSVVSGNAKFGTPERVNIDEAVRQLQKLSDKSEFGGSRLGQAFGSDGANRLLQDMYAAQRSGVKYMSHQVWAKRIATALGVGTAGGVGYEALNSLLGRTR